MTVTSGCRTVDFGDGSVTQDMFEGYIVVVVVVVSLYIHFRKQLSTMNGSELVKMIGSAIVKLNDESLIAIKSLNYGIRNSITHICVCGCGCVHI